MYYLFLTVLPVNAIKDLHPITVTDLLGAIYLFCLMSAL